MRRLLPALACLTILASPLSARAQDERGFSANHFLPAAGAGNFLTQEGAFVEFLHAVPKTDLFADTLRGDSPLLMSAAQHGLILRFAKLLLGAQHPVSSGRTDRLCDVVFELICRIGIWGIKARQIQQVQIPRLKVLGHGPRLVRSVVILDAGKPECRDGSAETAQQPL